MGINSVYHVGITSGIHEILHHREISSVYLVFNTNIYTVVETAGGDLVVISCSPRGIK